MLRTKRPLAISVIALILCVSMLLGTTFAWFTDSATSGNNVVQSGKLDVEMYWSDSLLAADSDQWQDADGTPIFTYDKWEPGYTEVRYIKVKNAGNLSLQWRLFIEAEGAVGELAEVIDVYYINPVTAAVNTLQGQTSAGALKDVIQNHTSANGVLLPAGETSATHTVGETILAVAFHMDEEAGNEYQGKSVGDGFSVSLIATQFAYESDSFGDKYDENAQWPNNVVVGGNSASAAVTPDANNKVSSAVAVNSTDGKIGATVPAGVKLAAGTNKLTLKVTDVADSKANITLSETEASLSIDVHIDGVAEDNDVVMAVAIKELLPVGLNMGNYRFYHVEDGATVEMTLLADGATPVHNNYEYDPATGNVVLHLKSFSEVALVADEVNPWNGTVADAFNGGTGTENDPYIIANADQFIFFGDRISNDNDNDKYYKLIADINLGGEKNANEGKIFYPIGYHKVGGTIATVDVDDAPVFIYHDEDPDYAQMRVATASEEGTDSWYTYGGSFKGVFDGDGHTISNIYQNTWQMKGNYSGNYWNAAMGIFGYVYGGTVKNLTVNNFTSDGEFTPTGVIAAYAAGDATFENIAITKCNPRVYNTGNGGIIGIAGDTRAAKDDHITLKNITVDNSNKISALWGSWDVACGGLVGMYRGNVDGNGNATGDTISFENCHVSAQIDVYNDVCANYQYYAYRYSGMIIGSVRHNTTNADGKTIPNMAGISASGCTVHFGTWNDYYYCEIIDNTTASYTHDYQMSRLVEVKAINGTTITYLDGTTGTVPASGRANYVVVDYTKGHGTANATCYHFKNGEVWNHEDGGKETINGSEVLKEDKQHLYLEFNNLFTGYGWGVSSMGIGDLEGVTILDREIANSVEKFETKFTGDFLYRVGNGNAVAIGNLFKGKNGVTINNSGVWVTIEKVDEQSNVGGTFTANTSDWTQGTIKFSGTGVVKVTIQDYNFCTPTVLYLEVVDAVNATTATSATSNNVVLLNDAGFGSLEVSGGYTLFGNGFTMTCGSDSAALDMGYAFVTLNNGTLDNVQIVCPNFDYAVLYKSNMTESGNRQETTDKTRYFNVKSGVMVSGNSQILNSRISGARAAVNVSGGNVVIDNSRIEGGAVASILVGSANSLTLRDVTLVQKPTVSTYDASKTLMGFSVLFVCDANGDAAPVTIEGTLVQNAWVDESDKQYVPSAGQSIISTVLAKTEYLHDVDGDGKNESLNLGFAYMPESLTSAVNTTTITDNRTNKDTVPYDYAEVSILNGKTYVYSYKNTNGTADSFKTESEYKPNKYSDIITVNYADTAEGLTTGKSFGTVGWVYELNVDLDKLPGYALDFSKLSMSVNGVAVTDFKVNGGAKPTSPVAVTAGGTTYTLTATVNGKECVAAFKVTGTETSKESPSKISGPTTAGFGVAKSYGGDWSGAADVLTGVKIKYWSVAENKYIEYDFSNFTVPGNAGKLNGTNSYWEYTHTNNDFTLKVTNTVAIHSGKSVYGMPIRGTDGKLYFTISSTNGYVGSGTTSRAITMQYEFTDNNGGEKLTFTHTFNISYSKDEQYSYSDLSGSGKLTELEDSSGSSGTCIAEGTMITLADGTQVRVDSLTGKEELLVWNMMTGRLDKAPIMFVDSDPTAKYEIVHLYFSDGTDVKVIYEHGFWDYDLNKYVYLDANASAYIGHTFAKQNGDSLEKVQLVDVVIENEITTAWSPVTADHLCYFVNGMLSMPGGVGGLFNIFAVDAETMSYDIDAMQKDIEKYGLYTYEELNAICPLSEEMFNAAGGAYLKVSIGKGNLTEGELIAMINRYSKFFK